MSTQYWDSARNVRTLAESIDNFLYIDGKTSPKIKQYQFHNEQQVREFLDSLRESLWDEYTDMMKDMGY